MHQLGYLFLIFAGAAIPFVEYMVAIPLGILAELPTVLVILAAFTGNLITVILLILLVDKIRAFIKKKRRKKLGDLSEDKEPLPSKQAQKAKKLWDKYGMPGLTLFGTFMISSHVTAMVASSLGDKTSVIIWMTISLAVWSVVLGVAVHFGLAVFFL